MKLEFLAEGGEDCPLIRLYDFNHLEVGQFVASTNLLAKGHIIETSLHQAPYVQSLADCRLTLKVGKRDKGVLKTGDNSFDWILTDEGWIDVFYMAHPFLDGLLQNHFQWLDERGEVRVLFSQDGQW